MAGNLVFCIGRQFGSGGQEIGLALANKLGLKFYDKEILQHAAEQSGIVQGVLEKTDEKLAAFMPAQTGAQKAASFSDYMAYLPNDQAQAAIAGAVQVAVEKDACVIMGRCADYILRGRAGMLSVYLHADIEFRIKRIRRLHNLDEDAARALVRKTDHNRAAYYRFYTDREWSAENYMLALDTAKLGSAACVDILCHAAGAAAEA